MLPKLDNSEQTVVANLNRLLRGEISAVETYNQAIGHLQDGYRVDDLVANRDCHRRRVALLEQNIVQHNGRPEQTSGIWGGFAKLVEQGAALISAKTVIAALEEGEDRGVAQYRKPGDLDPSSIQLIQTVLLPRQLETHERMRLLKMDQA